MKDIIENTIHQSKEVLRELSNFIYTDEGDHIKMFSQLFNNYNIQLDMIPCKDSNAFIASSNESEKILKIIFPLIFNSNNSILNKWKNSISIPIIFGAFISIHSLGDKFNGKILALGLPNEANFEKSPILKSIHNTDCCIFLDPGDKTRESGSSMFSKVLKIEFMDTLMKQNENNIRYSSPIDAQISFINTLNMLKFNIAEEIFINYNIESPGTNIFNKTKVTKITVALSSSIDSLIEEMSTLLEEFVYNTSNIFKVNGTIQGEITPYGHFNNNKVINRLFCHNLKEMGFVDIFPHLNKNINFPISQISKLVPSIIPTLGLKNISIQEDMGYKDQGIIHDHTLNTILDTAIAYANTILDISNKSQLINDIKNNFKEIH